MKNTYEDVVLNYATTLDSITSNKGEITQLVSDLILNHDDLLTIKILNKLSVFSESKDPHVVQVTKTLKDSIVMYYGYSEIMRICNKNEQIISNDEREKSLDELLKELDSLVGLTVVKNKVNDFIVYQKVQKMRNIEGLFSQKNTLHMAFMGNPGTGKTTVARIVGRMFKQLGLLSKGHFVEASRTDLIAGYQGQTALKVRKIIERSLGGVLFIDEAYSITENDHSDSYGRECLTELTKALEDFREDLVVIVAGYSKPMEKFFDSNPGLKSRFNTYIYFDDYSAEELTNIFENIAKKNNYIIDDKLRVKLNEYFFSIKQKNGENFANGRLARNLFDDLIIAHAKRVVKIESPSKANLESLLLDDLLSIKVM